MTTETSKLPLGGPAWLRAIANDREEMLHAIGGIDDEGEKEDRREIQGLRDAANKIERLGVVLRELELRAHSRYDFNADPDGMTKRVGAVLSS